MIGDRPIHIEVDGGITPETAPLVVAAGADVLVAGSAVFTGGSVTDPAPYGRNIRAIREAPGAACPAQGQSAAAPRPRDPPASSAMRHERRRAARLTCRIRGANGTASPLDSCWTDRWPSTCSDCAEQDGEADPPMHRGYDR